MAGRVRLRVHDGGEHAPPTADELLTRVATGDEQAFAALYDVVSGPVLGVTTRVLRDRGQAEEVTQEVLLEVWRKAARYRPESGSALAWVVTIAHRRAVDRVRSRQAAGDREDRAGRLMEQRPFDEVSESTMAGVERQRVRHCLAGLTEVQRDTIVLAYYNGYTYAEVAEVVRVPLGTVKTRIRDGLIRLRDCLGVDL